MARADGQWYSQKKQMASSTCKLYLACENSEIDGFLFWKARYNSCYTIFSF
jgi:hypothetical protein